MFIWYVVDNQPKLVELGCLSPLLTASKAARSQKVRISCMNAISCLASNGKHTNIDKLAHVTQYSSFPPPLSPFPLLLVNQPEKCKVTVAQASLPFLWAYLAEGDTPEKALAVSIFSSLALDELVRYPYLSIYLINDDTIQTNNSYSRTDLRCWRGI